MKAGGELLASESCLKLVIHQLESLSFYSLNFLDSLEAVMKTLFAKITRDSSYQGFLQKAKELTDFCSAGNLIEGEIKESTVALQSWIHDVYVVISLDQYRKVELKYSRYKNKLADLIRDIELSRLKGGKPNVKKLRDLDTVNNS